MPRKVDLALLKALARAKVWFEELVAGPVRSLTDIARQEKIAPRYVERLSRLAFAVDVVMKVYRSRANSDHRIS